MELITVTERPGNRRSVFEVSVTACSSVDISLSYLQNENSWASHCVLLITEKLRHYNYSSHIANMYNKCNCVCAVFTWIFVGFSLYSWISKIHNIYYIALGYFLLYQWINSPSNSGEVFFHKMVIISQSCLSDLFLLDRSYSLSSSIQWC